MPALSEQNVTRACLIQRTGRSGLYLDGKLWHVSGDIASSKFTSQ